MSGSASRKSKKASHKSTDSTGPVIAAGPGKPEAASLQEGTEVLVIFFDDMKGSTVLKESLAARSDEQAFQELRREHDALLREVIMRGAGGEVIKSTGDGLLAVFSSHPPPWSGR